MSSSQYLYRRASGIYFVRFCVPVRFKSAVGKGEVHRSTGCRDYRLAKIIAAELSAHWHRAITALERMDIQKIKAGSIKLLGDGYVSVIEAAELLGTTPLTLTKQLLSKNVHFYVEADGWRGWSIEDIDRLFPKVHDELGQVSVDWDLTSLGGPQTQTKFSGLLRLRFPQEAIDVLLSTSPYGICQFLPGPERAKIDRGFICDLPGFAIDAQMLEIRKLDIEAIRLGLKVQITPEMEAAAAPPSPIAFASATATATATATEDSIPFSEFTALYLKAHQGFWKNDQIRRRNDQCRLFLELMGDLPLKNINRICMRQFSESIKRIPDDRHLVRRKYECPTAGFTELISLADLHELKRLTDHAQHRLLDGISEIFQWAVKEELMSSNPATGLGGEVKKRSGIAKVKPQDQRDLLSTDDLNAIFSADWFSKGVGEKTAKGLFHAYRPHYFWLPLLALFNGGRLNELSQLYLNDIKVIEDVACLDFNLLSEDKLDNDEHDHLPTKAVDKSLKTVNAVRIVPIHQQLIDLGFLEYVEALKLHGYKRLFPELKFDLNKGYGKAAGSWFNERFLGTRLKIVRNGRKTFHSMRHNFATGLGERDAEVNVKSDLMGHARKGSETDIRYDKGALEKVKENIDRLSYALPPIAPFNIDEAIQSVKDALRLKDQHKKI